MQLADITDKLPTRMNPANKSQQPVFPGFASGPKHFGSRTQSLNI